VTPLPLSPEQRQEHRLRGALKLEEARERLASAAEDFDAIGDRITSTATRFALGRVDDAQVLCVEGADPLRAESGERV
jgi:hypothetical protein